MRTGTVKFFNESKGYGFITDEETGKEGLLIHPSPAAYDGQWVLIGKDDSWDEVKRYVEMLLYE